jgi:hypothetical protein
MSRRGFDPPVSRSLVDEIGPKEAWLRANAAEAHFLPVLIQ